MGMRNRTAAAAVSMLGAFTLSACTHQGTTTVRETPEEAVAIKSVEPASRSLEVEAPPKDAEKIEVLKTWLSREEVEAVREAEAHHVWEAHAFWSMRKDRESLRPTDLQPGGKCLCVLGDPLCKCLSDASE